MRIVFLSINVPNFKSGILNVWFELFKEKKQKQSRLLGNVTKTNLLSNFKMWKMLWNANIVLLKNVSAAWEYIETLF